MNNNLLFIVCCIEWEKFMEDLRNSIEQLISLPVHGLTTLQPATNN